MIGWSVRFGQCRWAAGGPGHRVGVRHQLARDGEARRTQTGKAPPAKAGCRSPGKVCSCPSSSRTVGTPVRGWARLGVTAGSRRRCGACDRAPVHLGLHPTALLVGTSAAPNRHPTTVEVLESTRQVDTIVLDKTGTATTGAMTLVDAYASRVERAELLRLAGALENASEHPIAAAIAGGCPHRGCNLPNVVGFANLGPGAGRRRRVGDRRPGGVTGPTGHRC